MRYRICVLLLCGCGGTAGFTNISSSPRKGVVDKTPQFTVTVQEQILTKQDESIVILRENTTALAAIKSQVEDVQSSLVETRQAVGTMEASMKAPALNMLGGDPAALEPQEVEGKESQPAILAASSPAVRLQYFTQAKCSDCKIQQPKAQAAADELKIPLEVFDLKKHDEAFTAAGITFTPSTLIVINDKIRVRFVGVVSASTIVARVNEELGKAMTSAPLTGAIFPVQAANTVASSRFTFRSVSWWQGHNRGQRVKTRTACSSGASP